MNYSFKSVDKRNERLAVDIKGVNDGYFFAAITIPTTKKLKLRVIKNDGSFEMFSFPFGDGDYLIILYEHAYGNRYATIGTVNVTVKLKNKNSPFLVPNQYVNYNQVSEVVRLTKELCGGKTKDDCYKIIQNYIKKTYAYDFIKARNVKSGTLPDIKNLLQKRVGICFDLAALATAMFRIVGIPAKLVIGFADTRYHAWVEVIGLNKSILYDPTVDVFGICKVKKYTPERFY